MVSYLLSKSNNLASGVAKLRLTLPTSLPPAAPAPVPHLEGVPKRDPEPPASVLGAPGVGLKEVPKREKEEPVRAGVRGEEAVEGRGTEVRMGVIIEVVGSASRGLMSASRSCLVSWAYKGRQELKPNVRMSSEKATNVEKKRMTWLTLR
jgi:hypothetical protein